MAGKRLELGSLAHRPPGHSSRPGKPGALPGKFAVPQGFVLPSDLPPLPTLADDWASPSRGKEKQNLLASTTSSEAPISVCPPCGQWTPTAPFTLQAPSWHSPQYGTRVADLLSIRPLLLGSYPRVPGTERASVPIEAHRNMYSGEVGGPNTIFK